MGILRMLRNRIWGKNFPAPARRGVLPADSPHRSQICAVIVTYNIGDAIHRCFDSIQGQAGHVLIIDNGSDETTERELVKVAAADSVTLILNERNEGVAGAYNQAVRWAREKDFQWILTLDHDSEATAGMVDELVRGYDLLSKAGVQNIGIVAPCLFDVNSQEYLCTLPQGETAQPFHEGEVLSSGSLIPLALFDSVGLFNEDLFVYYVDTEFCRRVCDAGYGIYICPKSVLLHREGTKKRYKFLWVDDFYDHYGKESRYYITRNTIYVIKNLPGVTRNDFRALFGRLWKDHIYILLFDKERLPILWFSLRGLVDGLRGKVGAMDSGSFVTSRAK